MNKNIIFLTLFLISVVFFSGCTSQPSTTTQTLITKPVTEMLPSQSELPTEWSKGEIKSYSLNESGFQEGIQKSIDKLEGASGMMFIDFFVFKFDTIENANDYYEKRVGGIKEGGGYTKIDVPDCFGWKEDFGIQGEDGGSVCVKKNIVFEVSGGSAQTIRSIDNNVKSMTELLKNKIN
jgi:hypothetical protein